MNKYLGIAAVFILAVGGAFWVFSGDEIVDGDVRLAAFAGNRGLLSMQMTQSLSDSVAIALYLDTNNDGSYDDGEKVGQSIVRPRAGSRISVPVSYASVPTVGMNVRIDIAGDRFERTLKEIATETDLMELDKVTDPEGAMKGLFAAVAYAQTEPPTEAGRINPDIGQKTAECAPTSAANSLISLAEEHGVSDQMPSDEDLINELKGDMDWTPANGVLPDNFVAGKNKWAARHGLPIRTEKVGDQHGRGTLEDILDAMASGAAAEIRIKFTDGKGKVTGGHMVTMSGIRTEGGQTFIEVSDPRTPEGSDIYEVNGNVIEGYPYDGIAVLSWGFVQHWEGSPTGTALEGMTDAEIEGIQEFAGEGEVIETIFVQNRYIPLSQVHVGKGEECDKEPHYHANNGSATATDGTVIPDPGGCGYGKVTQVPVRTIPKPSAR